MTSAPVQSFAENKCRVRLEEYYFDVFFQFETLIVFKSNQKYWQYQKIS